MSTDKKFPRLEPVTPVKFPSAKGKSGVAHRVEGTQGQPTKKVIAEIKRLSKKDIYATQ